VLGERGIAFGYGLIHPKGYVAIGEVAGGRGSQLGDVECLREIHFEERALAIGERQGVNRARMGLGIRARRRDLSCSLFGSLHS
jgi:hypothetical protein